jgi:hypothetical protein
MQNLQENLKLKKKSWSTKRLAFVINRRDGNLIDIEDVKYIAHTLGTSRKKYTPKYNLIENILLVSYDHPQKISACDLESDTYVINRIKIPHLFNYLTNLELNI